MLHLLFFSIGSVLGKQFEPLAKPNLTRKMLKDLHALHSQDSETDMETNTVAGKHYIQE